MTPFDHLFEFVRRRLESLLRWGWDAATSGGQRSHRRVEIRPEWLAEGEAIESALRISSPIEDVKLAPGTPVAVISRHGIPEWPAVLGRLWDDRTKPENLTVWLRADLSESPGHVELGATKSVQLLVGTNGGELAPLADGKLRLGSDAVDLVERLSTLASQLSYLADQLSLATTATSLGPQPLSIAANMAAIKLQIDAVKTAIDTLKS